MNFLALIRTCILFAQARCIYTMHMYFKSYLVMRLNIVIAQKLDDIIINVKVLD